jgi:hypothetical protein
LGLFALGALGGAVVTGLVVAGLGAVVQPNAGVFASGITVGVVGFALAVHDVRTKPFRALGIRRQTCPGWFRRFGPKRAWVMWGFDLGLGFSTIRVCSLYWMLTLYAVAFVPPVLAPAVFAAYGLTLALALFMAALVQRRHPEYRSPGLGLLGLAARVQMAGSVALLVVSFMVLAVATINNAT